MPRGGKPKDYPPEMVEQVRTLYDSGLTQAEVAQKMGTTQKVIWRLMRRHGLTTRKAIPRDQRGAKNASWKGDEVRYQALHMRVAAQRGRPKKCQRCGTTDPMKTYDWANLTGRYDDPEDYERMCRSCHRRYDYGRLPGG